MPTNPYDDDLPDSETADATVDDDLPEQDVADGSDVDDLADIEATDILEDDQSLPEVESPDA